MMLIYFIMSKYGFHVGVYDESDRLLRKFEKLSEALYYAQNFSKIEPDITLGKTKCVQMKTHCHRPPDDPTDVDFKNEMKSWIDKAA